MAAIVKVEKGLVFNIEEEVLDSLNKNYLTNIRLDKTITNPDYIWGITEEELVSFLLNTLDFSNFKNREFNINNKFLDTYYNMLSVEPEVDLDQPLDYTTAVISRVIPNIIYESVKTSKFLEDYEE